MKWACLLLACTLLAGAAENPVAWTVKTPAKPVAAGQLFTVQIEGDIQPGWHLYSLDQPSGGPIATEVSLGAGQPFELTGSVTGPKPHIMFDQNFDMQVQFYTDKANFKAPIKVADDASAGKVTLVVEARYQACNDNLCLPPKTVKAEGAVEIRRR